MHTKSDANKIKSRNFSSFTGKDYYETLRELGIKEVFDQRSVPPPIKPSEHLIRELKRINSTTCIGVCSSLLHHLVLTYISTSLLFAILWALC